MDRPLHYSTYRLTVDLTMDFEKLSVPAHMEQHMVV